MNWLLLHCRSMQLPDAPGALQISARRRRPCPPPLVRWVACLVRVATVRLSAHSPADHPFIGLLPLVRSLTPSLSLARAHCHPPSPTHLLAHSLARSLIHLFTHSLIHSFTQSLNHFITHSLTYSPAHAPAHPPTHPPPHSPTPSLARSPTPSLARSLTD